MKVAYLQSGQERIEKAFQTASTTTGASFDYLLKTAVRESNLDPQAKAKTSTAAGTFQFIESTWLETVKQSGERFGLSDYADKIERTAKGGYVVPDASARREILDLRHDPEVSALMAGALTQKNSKTLESFLGRKPSDGELYIAHFLGASGAKRLIGLAESRPDASAASYFKAQARANKPIFFESNGQARSAQAVYRNLVNRHDGTQLIGTALASVEPRPKPVIPTNAVTLAAIPVAKPVLSAGALPTQVAANTSRVDRFENAWNVVAATDDPAGLSNALKVAVSQVSDPARRFDQAFQVANASSRSASLADFGQSLPRVLAGDFQTLTSRPADRAGLAHVAATRAVGVPSTPESGAAGSVTAAQAAINQLAVRPVRTVELPRSTSSLVDPAALKAATINAPDQNPQQSSFAAINRAKVDFSPFRAGSVNDLPTDAASAASGPFQVKAPKTAFETLYRTDALAPRVKVGETFALAYAAQTSLFSSPGAAEAIDALFGQSGNRAVAPVSDGLTSFLENSGRQPGMPLDLNEYLRVRPADAQRELLPPV